MWTFFFHRGIDHIVLTEHTQQSVFLFAFFQESALFGFERLQGSLLIRCDYFYSVVALGYTVSTIFERLPEDHSLKCSLESDSPSLHLLLGCSFISGPKHLLVNLLPWRISLHLFPFSPSVSPSSLCLSVSLSLSLSLLLLPLGSLIFFIKTSESILRLPTFGPKS